MESSQSQEPHMYPNQRKGAFLFPIHPIFPPISTNMDPEVLTLGPEGEEWLYDPRTKTYDLTRNSTNKLRIATTRGDEVDSFIVNPSISALVVVDMQNWFLHPECREHPLGLETVDPTIRVIKKCREFGIQIIWLNWSLTDTDLLHLPATTRRHASRSLAARYKTNASDTKSAILPGYGDPLPDPQGRVLMTGSWNAAIYDPLQAHVQPTDVQCGKNRLSGMWSEDQPLRKHLTDARKRTLFFTGVNSDRCVLGTLADAAYQGWDCILIEDCCATTTREAHEVCVKNSEVSDPESWEIREITKQEQLMHGFVTDSRTFCEAVPLG